MQCFHFPWAVVWLVFLAGTTCAADVIEFKVPAHLADAVDLPHPGQIQMGGWLGERVANNAANRLAKVDLEPLLAGYRQRPGSHPWIGEHMGKWLHAATLAWGNSGNPLLRKKLDYAVSELIETQEADGYLGTYVPEQRFGLYRGADWDVWSHKYNLIGLLTYYRFTGDESALAACRRMGDLLCRTFPGKKSIIAAGTHVGMAATSVLEPMVLLYRHTGDERYLAFCRYVVEAWNEEQGPKIIKTLLAEKQVNKTANGKAYEMLSNLVGLCELARATGDRSYLEPVLIAWRDIVDKRLYITGTASQGEHFRGDHELPNHPDARIGETCVTTTWIQLNSQLLRLTGDAQFADELERTWYNHLAAAQQPDGSQWCYFTALEGTKPYGPGVNCCVSSGPRGMALVPPHACVIERTADDSNTERLLVNLYGQWRFSGTLGGSAIQLEQKSNFPQSGRSRILITTAKPAAFAIGLRWPDWADELTVAINDQPAKFERSGGWALLPTRTWQDGDALVVELPLTGRTLVGQHGNAGLAAMAWGPLVLAYDQSFNPGGDPAAALGWGPEDGSASAALRSSGGAVMQWDVRVRSARNPEPRAATLVAFADAGATGGRYRVWLRAAGAELPTFDSLSALASEARSRRGNVEGSITDGEADTFVVTFDNRPADLDWFEVRFDAPVSFQRVTFLHGKAFHDGGWFDATAGKPALQIQGPAGDQWQTVARFDDYPATTAADPAGLKSGEAFTVRLEQPVVALAVRVAGKPASGDNLRQAFSSCAELQVFEKP